MPCSSIAITAKPIRSWLETQPDAVKERWLNDERIAPLPPGTEPVNGIIASPVPGKDGHVFSPYTNRIIDVRGLPSGSLVMDPETRGTFRVP